MVSRRLRRLVVTSSVSLLVSSFTLLSHGLRAQDNPAATAAEPREPAPQPEFAPAGDLVRRSASILLAQQQGQQPAPPQQRPRSPFEEVPAAPAEGQQPQRPASPFEDVKEAPAEPVQPTFRGDVVQSVEFRGARRIPRDSLVARIFTKAGDTFDEAALRRDFMVLWNTGYFDDLRLEVEDGDSGKIVRFVVTERRIVRTIRYEGNKSATISDILERFKERRVSLSVENRYDPTTVQRAVIVLKELLGERGRQYATVTPEVRQIPPSSIEVVFNIEEGPKVKVGVVDVEGNTVISDKDARRAMKNTRPIGIPHSLIAFLALTAVMGVVLHRSVFGRHLFAVGKNEEAARYSGIRTTRVVIAAYVICCGLTAVAAIGLASRVEPPSHGGRRHQRLPYPLLDHGFGAYFRRQWPNRGPAAERGRWPRPGPHRQACPPSPPIRPRPVDRWSSIGSTSPRRSSGSTRQRRQH